MQEVLMGDPLMLDSYKPVDALLQRDRGQQYGAEGTDVKYKQTSNERRQLTPEFWEFAELFDPRDERGLMRAIAPDGLYVQNVAAAFNRKKDDVILEKLLGGVIIDGVDLGGGRAGLLAFRKDTEAAFGGQITVTLDTSVASTGNVLVDTLDTGTAITSAGPDIVGTLGELVSRDATSSDGDHGCQQIVLGDLATLNSEVTVAGTETTGATVTTIAGTETRTDVDPKGLHLKKLMIAHQVLQASGAAFPGQRIICVLHPEQVTQLLSESKYTSADYNALMPLQYGEAVPFMGMEFRVCNQIAAEAVLSGVTSGDLTNAAGGRYVYVYTEDANVFGQGDEMNVRFDEIPERGYSLQCYHDFSLGAVRMDPKKMVIVPCHAGTTAA